MRRSVWHCVMDTLLRGNDMDSLAVVLTVNR